MVRCFIFTIGFSPEFFTASVLGRYSVDSDDEVYLIRVRTGKEIDRKSDFAVLTIKQMLSSLNVKINEVFLDPYDSCKAIEELSKILYNKVNTCDEVIINVSGGPRYLLSTCIIATIIIQSLKPNTKIKVELLPEYGIEKNIVVDLTEYLSVIARGFEYMISRLRDKKLGNVLACLGKFNESFTISQVSDELNLDYTTTDRYFNDLYTLLLIKSSQDFGKGKRYALTCIGKILSNLLSTEFMEKKLKM